MYVMVLNDGETYTDLNGCRIVFVPDEATPEEIEEVLREDTWEYKFSDTFDIER